MNAEKFTKKMILLFIVVKNTEQSGVRIKDGKAR